MSVIVLYLRSNWVRCGIAALLFTFAVTADVLVKAVVDDAGHDANNPIIWIEHKCAGHFGKATQTAVLPQVAIVAAISFAGQLLEPAEQLALGSIYPDAETAASPGPPLILRC